MYPKWIEEVCRTSCGKCHVVPTPIDIISVGIARPNNIEAYIGPLAMLLVECPCCGERMYITLRESVESVVEAIHEFVKVVAEAARNVPPPIQLPRSKPRRESDRATERSDNSNVPLRPSVRDNQPDTPPTQREIQLFLHRL